VSVATAGGEEQFSTCCWRNARLGGDFQDGAANGRLRAGFTCWAAWALLLNIHTFILPTAACLLLAGGRTFVLLSSLYTTVPAATMGRLAFCSIPTFHMLSLTTSCFFFSFPGFVGVLRTVDKTRAGPQRRRLSGGTTRARCCGMQLAALTASTFAAGTTAALCATPADAERLACGLEADGVIAGGLTLQFLP